MDSIKVGERLRLLRGNRSRKEVAAACQISGSAVAMYEQGKRIPKDDVKIRIANYYKKSVNSIFFAE